MTRYRLRPITENIIPLSEIVVGYGENKDLHMNIIVDNESAKVGCWYFKIFDNLNRKKASRMNRITFDDAFYVKHNSFEGCDPWFLDDNEIFLLIKILKSKFYTKPEDKFFCLNGMRKWRAGIYIFNSYHGLPPEQSKLMHFNSPNYHPRYIPTDIKMPNYWALKRKRIINAKN